LHQSRYKLTRDCKVNFYVIKEQKKAYVVGSDVHIQEFEKKASALIANEFLTKKIQIKVPKPASQILADLKTDPKLSASIKDLFKVKVSFINPDKIELEGDKDSLTAAKDCIQEKINDTRKKYSVRTHKIKGNLKANQVLKNRKCREQLNKIT